MIALRVILNGKPVCTAGAEDLAVLSSMVTAGGPLGGPLGALTKKQREEAEPPHVHLNVGGLTGRREGADEHLRWAEQHPLQIGDRVEIEVLDTAEVDAPAETKPMDTESHAERERKQFEYSREVYLSLRHKYEPEKA